MAEQEPKIVEKLLGFAEEAKRDLGDYDCIGKGQRFFDKGPKRIDEKKRLKH